MRAVRIDRHGCPEVLTVREVADAEAGPGEVLVRAADHPLPDVPGATKSYVQEDAEQLGELARLVDEGALRLRVSERHPLPEVAATHRSFEAGGHLGKVLLTF